MMQYWSHFKYTTIHKYFVFLECCKRGIIWRGIIHDMSKFSPTEFGAYANYFFKEDGTRRSKPENGLNSQVEAFDRAWCHHSHRNDHHYNYWVVDAHYSTNNLTPVMPTEESIKEMAADMIGANLAQGGSGIEGAKKYYLMNSDRIDLHPRGRSLLEKELGVKQ